MNRKTKIMLLAVLGLVLVLTFQCVTKAAEKGIDRVSHPNDMIRPMT